MNIAIIDKRADEKTVESLEKIGIKVIPTVEIDGLYDAVSTHTDIQIHYIGKNRFICAPETYSHYKKKLPQDVKLIIGSQSIGLEYPYDITYNTAAFGEFVICNSRYTAIEIIETYKSMNKKFLNVRQGYSKCNTVIVNENAIITEDTGIYNKAAENKIDVLKISSGSVGLRGMSYGFLGGATGLIEKNVLAVNGDINTHSDAESVKNFLKKHKVEVLPLKSGILEDIGSIVVNFDVQV